MRILLTGTARCGSTWAANVLGLADGAQAVFEPDGPASDVLGAMVAARLGSHPALEPSSAAFGTGSSGTWPLSAAGRWRAPKACALLGAAWPGCRVSFATPWSRVWRWERVAFAGVHAT